jgi:hypothetical protein
MHFSKSFFYVLVYSKSPTDKSADIFGYKSCKKYLSISFSHDWYPANKRFASVELRWNSVRPVKRITWKPSPRSSLYSFRLDGNAGAFAASTHSSKEVSLNSCDLKNQGKM